MKILRRIFLHVNDYTSAIYTNIITVCAAQHSLRIVAARTAHALKHRWAQVR